VFDPAALRARLDSVRDRIARAAGRAGRDPSTVRLVAVSKTFDVAHIRAAADAGQRDFGENKVQEGLAKIAAVADLRLTWHLIGHVQSNKVRKAAAHFDLIHSIDAPTLLDRVNAAALAEGRSVDVLIQVDLAGEATKHGAARDALLAIFETARTCHAARVTGLMVLPPSAPDPQAIRPYFTALRTVRDELAEGGADPSMLSELSMGMSHDFEVAIEEGATLVRVGSAIFGERAHV
jgi:pyridoxal phosphate enzyme (YggS family)